MPSPFPGMDPYLEQPTFWSSFHSRLMVALVEIDLLRGDAPLPIQGSAQLAHYRILVSRAEKRPQADLYAVTVREPLPRFPLPLRAPEEAVLVDLSDIFRGVYDRASYDLRIDYTQTPPPPPFSVEDQAWIEELLRVESR